MSSRQAARMASRVDIDNIVVFPHSENGRYTSLEGIGGLDGAREPDVDEDRVSTGRNCDGCVGVVIVALDASYVHASMPIRVCLLLLVLAIDISTFIPPFPTIFPDLSHPPISSMVPHSPALLFIMAKGHCRNSSLPSVVVVQFAVVGAQLILR